ncbi:hypothetical protein EJ03DRAFT_389344 [Teratosphaeria nubilosa]|uniref:Hypervirulence associated protein TUDOR domain-containing protein n=1 Tax=Teratosphaeria nubilosa TaxID=161662 RepID=A0A6G1L9M9_9PEZI|nr:hypothetical protein EJ03DRAFT_389344 [Teratosphaeria nubilosa]
MPPKDKHSDPKLRDEIKEEIHNSDKGGAPGQWSARKAQMMAAEYKKRGGDYNTDKSEQDESQKNLSKWGEEEWQTKEGSANAKQEDGTQKRYLPKKAWENMTEEEKEATEEKKAEGSKEGKQFVGNTEKAKESREKANKEESEKYEKEQEEKRKGGKTGKDGKGGKKDDKEQEEDKDDAEEEYQDDSEAEVDQDDAEEPADNDEDDHEEEEEEDKEEKTDAGQKRKSKSQPKASSKKPKPSTNGETGNAPKGKIGSKHMDASDPAPRGSKDRLPKRGQKVTWKAMPGWVEGTVTEVLTQAKKVEGKDVKASEADPRVVMVSGSSGKVCVHRIEDCCFE